jgi:exodeoxyribonuclease VII large subunit
MQDKYLTVTALTRYLKYKLEADTNLKRIYLKGEISNFKAHSTGHFYFSIKDENSIIRAIMFNSNAKKLNFIPTEGMKVLITGSISVYPASGNYQIYVEDLIEDGVGNLYVAFLKLKEKLSKEGLFDEKYKKPIPKIPSKVGIVTASTGAAVRDIISTIRRRFPLCETYLFPCLVQGENASNDIIEKVKMADNYGCDVLIVGRGGGSFEDMNCFNDETLARTIFACKTPVISAVGHEVDYTIIDFVSDLRAPTPTGAAEMAVPNSFDVLNNLNQFKIRSNEAILKKVKYQMLKMDAIKSSYVIKNPMLMYQAKQQRLDIAIEKLNKIIFQKIDTTKLRLNQFKNNYIIKNPELLYEKQKDNLNNLIEKLELVNPLSLIKKGYSLTYKNDKIVSSIKEIKKGDNLKLRVIDGNILVTVNEVEK